MAIVSKVKNRLKNGEDVDRIVKYTKGVFSMDLPNVVVSDLHLDKKYVEATTEAEVNKLYDYKLKEWAEASTETSTVIFIKTKFKGAIFTDEFREKQNKGLYVPAFVRSGYVDDILKFKGSGSRNDDSCIGMELVWGVYSKKTVLGRSRYEHLSGRWLTSSEIDGRYGGVIELPWDQDKENFFLDIDEKLANLMFALQNALGDLTEDKLHNLMTSGVKLINS